MSKEGFANWSDLKRILQDTDKKELIDLIQDFYEHPAENRQKIIFRHTIGSKSDWVLESFRTTIRNEFFPEKEPGEPRYDVIRETIREYSEGSGDVVGTMELRLFFVENVVEFVNEYGGINEEFIDEGCEMLKKYCEFLKTPDGQQFYPNYKVRLLKLRHESNNIGYGFGEDIDYYVQDVEDFFEEKQHNI
jgi:hypothetical protein